MEKQPTFKKPGELVPKKPTLKTTRVSGCLEATCKEQSGGSGLHSTITIPTAYIVCCQC